MHSVARDRVVCSAATNLDARLVSCKEGISIGDEGRTCWGEQLAVVEEGKGVRG